MLRALSSTKTSNERSSTNSKGTTWKRSQFWPLISAKDKKQTLSFLA